MNCCKDCGILSCNTGDNCGEDKRCHNCGKEYHKNLGEIRCKEELNCFTNVIVNSSSFANSGNDGCKVIVCKYHIGNVLCYVGTCNSHSNTDVGIFNGGSVVNAVTRHSGNLAFFTPSINYSRLMLGLNTRVNAVFFNCGIKFFIGYIVKLGARNCL